LQKLESVAIYSKINVTGIQSKVDISKNDNILASLTKQKLESIAIYSKNAPV